MFRASQFPSLSRPPFFLSDLRLPVLSSLDFSSFKSPPSSSFSKFPPLPRLRAPAASSFPSPFSRRPPSMMGNPRLRGKASFSAGSTGRQNKELLVQHLLVGEDNLKLLLDLQQRISGGDDLSDLAVEYSICPSKENGGMLGWVRRGQTVPEFEEAAFNAPLNKVVCCRTKFGWHLLQVLSEREESVLLDIEPEELHSKMQDPSFIEEAQLIDVREPAEVAQASLPGFKILPLRQFGTWGSVITDEFDPQKDTYVLCHHGVRSLQVAKWLQTQVSLSLSLGVCVIPSFFTQCMHDCGYTPACVYSPGDNSRRSIAWHSTCRVRRCPNFRWDWKLWPVTRSKHAETPCNLDWGSVSSGL